MTQAPSKGTIEIREFEPGDAEAFYLLNEAWISKHFGMENHDRLQLREPEKILAKGGRIFVVSVDRKAIGTCALIPEAPGVYELAKMAVSADFQGQGIGRRLLEFTIAEAKAMSARRLCLGSSRKLPNAIHLYEAFGFKHLPPERIPQSPYKRANVFMELELSS